MGRCRQIRSKILFFAAVLLLATHPLPTRAQSLSNLRIGDDATKLKSLGTPSNIDTYKSFTVQKWKLANGNELSITTSGSGRIVYIESDSGGRADEPGCDLPGLRFGVTTLSDLRKRFGNNGFGFTDRGPGVEMQESVAMFNSYEVGPLVVTFITVVNRAEYLQAKNAGKNPSIAEYAKLDAISFADAEYAKGEWGDRVYDPNYKKIEWK